MPRAFVHELQVINLIKSRAQKNSTETECGKHPQGGLNKYFDEIEAPKSASRLGSGDDESYRPEYNPVRKIRLT